MSASLQHAGVILQALWCLWCAARNGVPRDAQGTARDHLALAHQQQAHPHIASRQESSAALEGQLLAVNICRLREAARNNSISFLDSKGIMCRCSLNTWDNHAAKGK